LNYQRKFNKAISRVILTGGGVAMKGVFELARANFQTEVVMGDPFNKVESPAFLEDVLKVTGLEFSTALGLALRKLQELN
jgi:cell division ATPase FtsA